MKRYIFIALIAVVGCKNAGENKNNAQQLPTSIVNNPHTANGLDTVSAAMKPVMKFDDTLHEFGTIHQGESVSHEFSFTNMGKTALIITGAVGSCGCTVPEYPHDPIQPGKSGIMKVTFNSAGKQGHQEKSVTISTNTVRGTHMLYIKGEVLVDKK